jgi:hypothetical protein
MNFVAKLRTNENSKDMDVNQNQQLPHDLD